MAKKVQTKIDDNVYRKKEDGTYEAIGLFCNHDYLSDGIWYIHHHETGGRGFTNGKYLEGIFEIPRKEKLNLSQICDLSDLTDRVMDSQEYRNIQDQRMSMYEFMCKIIAIAQNEAAKYAEANS